jgi:hypothetical protein
MKLKYRVKVIYREGNYWYYPQIKKWWWWINLCDKYGASNFAFSFNEAVRSLREDFKTRSFENEYINIPTNRLR